MGRLWKRGFVPSSITSPSLIKGRGQGDRLIIRRETFDIAAYICFNLLKSYLQE